MFNQGGILGLVNRPNRRVFAIVQDRMRVADSLARQLQTLGLEWRERPEPSLDEYMRKQYLAEAHCRGEARSYPTSIKRGISWQDPRHFRPADDWRRTLLKKYAGGLVR